jgi:hypothetical protein
MYYYALVHLGSLYGLFLAWTPSLWTCFFCPEAMGTETILATSWQEFPSFFLHTISAAAANDKPRPKMFQKIER